MDIIYPIYFSCDYVIIFEIRKTMPIYEYVCLKCELKFEMLRSFNSSDKGITCEKCGSQKIKRTISIFNAHGSSPASSGGVSCASCSGANCASCK